MSLLKIQGIANSNFDKIEMGTAEFRFYTSAEVLKRSLKQLFLYWALALFSVLLPVVHFVLVPLFFILGIALSFRARKLRQEILGGTLCCPQCKVQTVIDRAPFDKEISQICQSCASLIKITVISN